MIQRCLDVLLSSVRAQEVVVNLLQVTPELDLSVVDTVPEYSSVEALAGRLVDGNLG